MTFSLPTTRHLLTSLFNSLTDPAGIPAHTQPINATYDAPRNPLKCLPPSHRALLTTLHVLFPPPTLLQALDLLDRGLVTQIILRPQSQRPHHQDALERIVQPPQTNVYLPTALGGEDGHVEVAVQGRNAVYQVRSSQAPKGRFKDVSASSAIAYTVRLGAWSCSCAAFAFSAFPGSVMETLPWGRDDDVEEEEEQRGGEEKEREWEFGGMSADGVNGGSVSVCKHLLACLLAERWEGVLGSYVNVKEVGRDEMAGIGCEG